MGAMYLLKPPFYSPDNKTSNLATLAINFETLQKYFEGDVIEGMTILDALNMAVSAGNLKLNYIIDKSGNVSVVEIDGYTNGTNNKYFVFYLNSAKVPTEDLNKQIIHGGDKIEIRYQ
jgi:hypothetical protein